MSDLTTITSQLCEFPKINFTEHSYTVPSIQPTLSDTNSSSSNYIDLVAEYKSYLLSPNEDELIKTPGLGDLLIKQGEIFCRDIWPDLSIRKAFFKHCNIIETLNTVNDALPVMTEMDSDALKTFATEIKKSYAKDFLGFDLPDLSFMLASNIQWPPEYLKQI